MSKLPFSEQYGFSMAEFLIAILLLSISTLALIKFQHAFFTHLYQQNVMIEGERLAFSQLDIYPKQQAFNDKRWSYQFSIIKNHNSCHLVKVMFTHQNGHYSEQIRWRCLHER